ncbi:hypothetical protein EKK58_03065 [Candidatus Dependentiae bacterium]|nr:MAG: hypothetical protein EKK58_03065 [Candidatus Dependentiae bacterium]
MLTIKQAIVLVSICANKPAWSMNIGGDLTPIKITTEKYYQKELLNVPGNVNSNFGEKRKVDEDRRLVINNRLYTGSKSEYKPNIFAIEPLITEYLLNAELPQAGGALFYALKNFSTNKYIQYITILAFHLRKGHCTIEALNEYFKEKSGKCNFFHLCKYLKVQYYKFQYQQNGFFSIEAFSYLKKLNKKYTRHLADTEIIVENSELSTCKLILEEHGEFFNVFGRLALVTGAIADLAVSACVRAPMPSSEDLMLTASYFAILECALIYCDMRRITFFDYPIRYRRVTL